MTRVFVSADVPEGTGGLARITAKIAEKGINVRGFSSNGREMRFLVENPEAVKRVLKDAGLTPTEVEVFEITLPNEPGALARVSSALAAAGVDIESAFGFAGDGRVGHLYLDVSDVERAAAAVADVDLARAMQG